MPRMDGPALLAIPGPIRRGELRGDPASREPTPATRASTAGCRSRPSAPPTPTTWTPPSRPAGRAGCRSRCEAAAPAWAARPWAPGWWLTPPRWRRPRDRPGRADRARRAGRRAGRPEPRRRGARAAFGPDVASASRATLGGMIANNSAGARSIAYGLTADHVLSLDVTLADGTRTTLRRGAPAPPALEAARPLAEGFARRGSCAASPATPSTRSAGRSPTGRGWSAARRGRWR